VDSVFTDALSFPGDRRNDPDKEGFRRIHRGMIRPREVAITSFVLETLRPWLIGKFRAEKSRLFSLQQGGFVLCLIYAKRQWDKKSPNYFFAEHGALRANRLTCGSRLPGLVGAVLRPAFVTGAAGKRGFPGISRLRRRSRQAR